MDNQPTPTTRSSTALSITPPAGLPSTCLGSLAESQHVKLEGLLKIAEFARANNFDLIGAEGWELLRNELTADFPYLTLADLSATIKLGVKGKLDTYKNRPLNFTRVYQWVEQRVKASRGYWRHHYPELMAWAALTRVEDAVLDTVFAHEQQNEVGKVLGTIIREAIGKAYLSSADPAQNSANLAAIKTEAWPAFQAQYPAFAAKHPNLF